MKKGWVVSRLLVWGARGGGCEKRTCRARTERIKIVGDSCRLLFSIKKKHFFTSFFFLNTPLVAN